MFSSDFSQSLEAGLPPETIDGQLPGPVDRCVPADGRFLSELVCSFTRVTLSCLCSRCLHITKGVILSISLPKTEVSRQRKTTGVCNKTEPLEKTHTHCIFFLAGNSLNDKLSCEKFVVPSCA